jgi:hypothetical protein
MTQAFVKVARAGLICWCQPYPFPDRGFRLSGQHGVNEVSIPGSAFPHPPDV